MEKIKEMTWKIVDTDLGSRNIKPFYEDGNVKITPNLATIGDVTCAVSNINSVFIKRFGDPSWLIKFNIAFFSIAAALSFFIYIYMEWAFFKNVALCVAIITTITALGFWYDVEKRPYALVLSTSSGDRYALIGQDRVYLDVVRQYIEAAMAAPREVVPASTLGRASMECPRCAETIKAAAKVCRFCGHELDLQGLEQP